MFSSLKRQLRAFAARRQALILTYHSITSAPLPFAISQHLPVDRFEKQVSVLANRFRCVSLSTLVSEIKQGKIEPYTIAITFDDGFYNNFSVAYPILKHHGIPATFFLSVGYIGTHKLLWPEMLAIALMSTEKKKITLDERELPLSSAQEKADSYIALTRGFKGYTQVETGDRVDRILQLTGHKKKELQNSPLYNHFRMLGWDDVCELAHSGLIELGSHSLTHPRLTRLSPEEASVEIADSKRQLEQRVGAVRYFAYPYGGRPGDFTEKHRNMAAAAGYEALFTAMHGTVTSASDIFDLPRVNVSANDPPEVFDYLLHGGAAMMAR